MRFAAHVILSCNGHGAGAGAGVAIVMCAGGASHAAPSQSLRGMGFAVEGVVAGEAAGVDGAGFVALAAGDGGFAVCAVLAPGENAKQNKMAATPKFFNTMAPM